MDGGPAGGTGGVVGRKAEFTALHAYLDGDDTARTLLLTGEPGKGKTTLWQAGIDAARGLGLRVLVARPSGAETQLAYGALIDLLDGVRTAELDLADRQRHALEVAILRAGSAAEAVEPSAVALAFPERAAAP